MKATVCEFRNDLEDLEEDWNGLVAHAKQEASELVLLPEMPFYPWVAATRNMIPEQWQASAEAHEKWISRLEALAPAIVFGTRPIIKGGRFLNEGFVWDHEAGYNAVHTKYYLPNENGFWEASWYERGDGDFGTFENSKMKAGFLICTEIWFLEHARAYGKQKIQLLLCPRATPKPSADKWVAGGRTAAVVSGAFCLSSNRGEWTTMGLNGPGQDGLLSRKKGRFWD